MGQAFDRDGAVLAEATGETKREVLDKLERMAPDAAELRIKSAAASADVRREPMMQFFRYTHLPLHLQAASAPFCELAERIEQSYPRNPERTVTLRKLLEAKDAAVRTLLYEQ